MAQSALWSYGGSVMKDNKLNLDSPETREALKMLLGFFEDGSVAPDMISGDDMANNTAFLSGTAGFIVNIPTIAAALQKDAPDIWENTGVCPLPAGPEGAFSLVSPGTLLVFNRTEEENYWIQKCLAYVADKERFGQAVKAASPAYVPQFEGMTEDKELMSDPVVAAHLNAVLSGKMIFHPDSKLTKERSVLTQSDTYINNFISYVVVDKMSFEDALKKQIELCERALDSLN
jgi:ABC-type glycerol-3-phosphate transport system substrate-binding protein